MLNKPTNFAENESILGLGLGFQKLNDCCFRFERLLLDKVALFLASSCSISS